jgi:hypothetical protein
MNVVDYTKKLQENLQNFLSVKSESSPGMDFRKDLSDDSWKETDGEYGRFLLIFKKGNKYNDTFSGPDISFDEFMAYLSNTNEKLYKECKDFFKLNIERFIDNSPDEGPKGY